MEIIIFLLFAACPIYSSIATKDKHEAPFDSTTIFTINLKTNFESLRHQPETYVFDETIHDSESLVTYLKNRTNDWYEKYQKEFVGKIKFIYDSPVGIFFIPHDELRGFPQAMKKVRNVLNPVQADYIKILVLINKFNRELLKQIFYGFKEQCLYENIIHVKDAPVRCMRDETTGIFFKQNYTLKKLIFMLDSSESAYEQQKSLETILDILITHFELKTVNSRQFMGFVPPEMEDTFGIKVLDRIKSLEPLYNFLVQIKNNLHNLSFTDIEEAINLITEKGEVSSKLASKIRWIPIKKGLRWIICVGSILAAICFCKYMILK
jgi:hypothetical protein